MTIPPTTDPDRPGEGPPLELSASGDVPDGAGDHVEEALDRALTPVARQVRSRAARLVVDERHGPPHRCRCRVTVRLRGRTLRAEAVHEHLDGAIDLATTRIRQQVEHLRRSPRERAPLPPPPRRPSLRPLDGGELVRRKSFTTRLTDLEEARFDADLLGHDFFLFTDATTRETRLLDRTAEDEVVHELADAPRIGLEEARFRLREAAVPFVFFKTDEFPTGAVVYARLDGNDGLLEPRGLEPR